MKKTAECPKQNFSELVSNQFARIFLLIILIFSLIPAVSAANLVCGAGSSGTCPNATSPCAGSVCTYASCSCVVNSSQTIDNATVYTFSSLTINPSIIVSITTNAAGSIGTNAAGTPGANDSVPFGGSGGAGGAGGGGAAGAGGTNAGGGGGGSSSTISNTPGIGGSYGGGGAAGAGRGSTNLGGNGGNGGGSITVFAATKILVNGTLNASGSAGSNAVASSRGGGGGGGAGGKIQLSAANITIPGTVEANGANGGTGDGANRGGGGGGGGGGFINLSATYYSASGTVQASYGTGGIGGGGTALNGSNGTSGIVAVIIVYPNSPSNNSTHTSLPILNFTAISSTNSTLSCNITVNGTVVYSNSSVANNTATLYQTTNSTTGTYYWNATCADTYGSATSSTWQYNVGLIPQVAIISPTAKLYSTSTILVNLSANYSDNTYYNWNGTNASYSSPVNVTFPDGNHTLFAYVNNSFGSNSSNVSFSVDTTTPQVQFVSPTPANGTYNTSQTFNVTANGTNLANITIYVNGTANKTCAASSSCSITLNSEGTYLVNASANNTVGATNFTGIRNITLDFTAPSIVFNASTPTNGTYNTSKNITVNANDAHLSRIVIYVNGSAVQTCTASPCTYILSNTGTYNFYAKANDTAGNTNITENRTVIIDKTQPIVSFVSPTPSNGTMALPQTINVSAYVESGSSIDTITIYANGVPIYNCTSSSYCNYSMPSYGNYLVNASANNTLGNISWTETRNFTFISGIPGIWFNNDTDNDSAVLYRNYIIVNASASCPLGISNVTIFLYNQSGSLINSTTSTTCPLYMNYSGLQYQNYSFNATAYNVLNNSNSTETRHVELSNTPILWSSPSINETTVYWNSSITFNTSWTSRSLAGYIFSTNQSGSWANSSYVPFSGTSNVSTATANISANPGTTVGWYFFANDTSGISNQTAIQTFNVSARPTNLALTVNQSVFLQSQHLSGTQYYIGLNSRFSDALSGDPLNASGTCIVSNNQTSTTSLLTYNETTGNMTGTLNTDLLHGLVGLSISCSKSRYASSTANTTAEVRARFYLSEGTNETYGPFGNYTTHWTKVPQPTGPMATLTLVFNTTASNDTAFPETFMFYAASANHSLPYSAKFKGQEYLKVNMSINDSSCRPYLCMHVFDSTLSEILTNCGAPVSIPTDTPTVVTSNLTKAFEMDTGTYFSIQPHFDCNDTIELSASVYYNYSDMPISLEIMDPERPFLNGSITNVSYIEPGYTLGPNQTANSTINISVALTNSENTSKSAYYSFISPILSNYPNIVAPNMTYIYNSTDLANPWASTNYSSGAQFNATQSGNVVSWQAENVSANSTVTERVKMYVIDALFSAEQTHIDTPTLKQWNVKIDNVFSHEYMIYNINSWTNYSAYGVPDSFGFDVSYTNSSGIYNVTSQCQINTTTKAIYFPSINVPAPESPYFTVNARQITPPNVTLLSPAKGANYSTTSVDINFTASDEVAIDKCWYSFDGGANTSLPSCLNTTKTSLTPGTHNITVYANNTVGLQASDFASFNISVSVPNVSFSNTTPQNGTYGIAKTMEVLATGENLSTIVIYANGTDVQECVANNCSYVLSTDGIYLINATANNTFGGTGRTPDTRRIVIDTTAPQWSNASKNETTVYWNQSVSFSANWADYSLAGYKFSTNQSGAWVNSSYITFGGSSNVSSNVSLITANPGTSVGWLFYANDTFGHMNQTDIQTFTVSARPTNATMALNGSTFAQSAHTGTPQYYIGINARFTDSLTGAPINGDAICTVTNNQTASSVYLTYNNTTGNMTGSFNTDLLHGSVGFTLSCSKSKYASSSATAAADVHVWLYMSEGANETYGPYGNYTTHWAIRIPPSGTVSTLTAVFNTTASNDTIFPESFYYYGQGINHSVANSRQWNGQQYMNINISINDSSCKPYICLHILDGDLNNILTKCSSPVSISPNTPTVVSGNLSETLEMAIGSYFSIMPHFDCSDAVELSASVYYNYSGMPATIEFTDPQPASLDAKTFGFAQLEQNYTVGPNMSVNGSIKMSINFTNSANTSKSENYFFMPPILSNYPDSVLPNSSYIYNSTDPVNPWASTNYSAGAPVQAHQSGNVINWQTENVSGNTTVTETITMGLIGAIMSTEDANIDTPAIKQWNTNLWTIFAPEYPSYNVTAWTNYSSYVVPDDFGFQINYTNSSGTFDVTSSCSIDNATKTITFPMIDIGSNENPYFTVTASEASLPNVTIDSPTDVANYSTTSVDLNFTAYDEVAIDQCWYSLDGAANTTITSCLNTTLNSLTNGNHSLTVYANNTAGFEASDSVSFNISVQMPNVSFSNSTPQNGTYGSSQTIEVIASDPNLDVINIFVNGSDVQECTSSPCYYSLSSDGIFIVNATANNTFGFVGRTPDSRRIIINTVAPQWFNASKNETPVYWNQTVSFTTDWVNVELDGYLFSTNQSGSWVNSSFVPFSGASNTSNYSVQITASPGTDVAWYFYANDTAGNSNQTDVFNFTVQAPSTTVAFSVNQTDYPQGRRPGFNYTIAVPFEARFADDASDAPISGALCRVSNNLTEETVDLSFNDTTENYSGQMDDWLLWNDVTFTVNCSKENYSPSSNTTSARFWWYGYLWEWENRTIGDAGGSLTQWLRKEPSEGATPYAQENILSNLSSGINNGSLFTYFYGAGKNGSFSSDFTLSGNVALKFNLSLNDSACMPRLCFATTDYSLNELYSNCGGFVPISADVPTLIESNITIFPSKVLPLYGYVKLRVDLNCSSTVSENATLYYNYSGMAPNIEALEFARTLVNFRVVDSYANESNLTVGPNGSADSRRYAVIELNNTDTFSKQIEFVYQGRLISTYVNATAYNASYIYNSTGELWASSNASAGAPHVATVNPQNQVFWITEVLPAHGVLNNTVTSIILGAVRDNETLLNDTSATKIWSVNLFHVFTSAVPVANITAWTNYSIYGAEDNFNFSISAKNSSGTFDITSLSTFDNTTKTITFPMTDLDPTGYVYTITALAPIPPSVAFVSPTPENGTYAAAQTVNATANYSDNLVIFVNGVPVKNCTASYCDYALSTPGTFEFFAYANNSFGEANTSVRSITITGAAPTINSASVYPQYAVNGSSVSIYISASGAQSVWANITLPDASVVTLPLTNNANTSFSQTGQLGTYAITYFANSSTGEISNLSGSLQTFPPFNFFMDVEDQNSDGLNSTLVFFYNGTQIQENSSGIGLFNVVTIDQLLDVLINSHNGSMQLTMHGVNLTDNNYKVIGLGRNSSVDGYLVVVGVNNSENYTFNTTTVRIYYNGTSYTNEGSMSIWKCSQFDYSTFACIGSWTDMTPLAFHNITGQYFELNVTSFSGFAIKQNLYCGDNICGGGETCSSCPADCGLCKVSGPSTGGGEVLQRKEAPTENVTPPVSPTQNESAAIELLKSQASASIESAVVSIGQARDAGMNVSSAQDELDGARKAFSEGDYALAKSLADSAKYHAGIAQPLSPISYVPILPEQPKVPAAPSAGQTPPQVSEALPLIAILPITLLLGIAIIAVVAYLMLKKKRPHL